METSPERLRIFAYVDADKAPLYRRIMRAFMVARDGFRLHLRPQEVRTALGQPEQPEVDAALTQLCAWGNLVPHPDTAEVGTVEEFYRQRFLYQLSAQGEAAERAVSRYEQDILRPGELQTAALSDIRAHLNELLVLASESEPEQGKVHRVLTTLRARFGELTDRAQAFMGSLQRGIDLQGLELTHFLHYKQRLIDYLERFIGELLITTAEAAELLVRIEQEGVERLLRLTAERELVDRLGCTEADLAEAHAAWRRRWEGLRAWFLGRDAEPSQAEVLRARARSAIPALLGALAGINERRLMRTDRAQDFRTLARWFAEALDDASAHRLWRAAFGLAPARHLGVDTATLAEREQHPIPSSTSWLSAPPLRISPRLRATGRHTRKGRANSVVDRSEAKAHLARSVALEARQLEDAQRLLDTHGRMRLADLGALERRSFDLLLDLLGEALCLRVDARAPVEATSSDGTLHIHLEPTRDGRHATLTTADGVLTCPDFFVTIRPTLEPSEDVPHE
ncbi:TIGR02677 family protein [Myxococcus fulvus]|uniref:TIGR02677 family protein n=1 Tax=Myxococcus fulvus TaxID=33 RepID=UPI0020BDFA33|nr:TIGR02677 family protein [Myxococcus fulvus]MCK8501807.1 TIGR02677 family protein [Myxococcus fulvus]